MTYFEKYKTRLLKDDNIAILQKRTEESNDFINNNFTVTHGYWRANVIENIDEQGYEIDVVVNSKTDGLQKDFVLRPNNTIRVGSYISYNKKTYIIRELETDDNTPTALGFLCNREIKFKSTGESLPVYTNSTTYGSKGKKYFII